MTYNITLKGSKLFFTSVTNLIRFAYSNLWSNSQV